jgi:anthranilate phosphoribosyltransferase
MSINNKDILERLLSRDDLTEAEAGDLMRALADEELPQAMSAALLIALRAKGETAEEVRGFAIAMRQLAKDTTIPDGMIAADIVGTGGDGSGSLNISTGTALLTAACGVPVIKHGNRSVSSKSGSADVLEAMGIPLPKDPESATACLSECGFTFLFAPFFHPAMKAIAPVRGAMGVRTVFNILGPLTNPARPPFNLIGAFDLPTARLMADTLAGMDIRRAFVIHGEPGWDEATPVGPFTLFDVTPGEVTEETRDPADAGIARCTPRDLAGGDAEVNAGALEAALSGADKGPHRDALVLGAALVLELTGKVSSLEDGVRRAGAAIDAGDAAGVVKKLKSFGAAA